MNGPNWAEIVAACATALYVILTGVIAWFARDAYRAARDQLAGLRDQLATDREHHSEQMTELRAGREASLRPHLILGMQLASELRAAVVTLLNVGPGPALNVTVSVTLVRTGETRRFERQAIPAGERENLIYELALDDYVAPNEDFSDIRRVVIRVDCCDYADIFQNEFHAKLISTALPWSLDDETALGSFLRRRRGWTNLTVE